jgi:Gas vesicle protein K
MRIEGDREDLARSLARLVLTLIELLRQLMERQAIRRVEGGGLSEEQIERLGRALIGLEQRMEELKASFELADDDLNLNLGPLGNLL